MTKITDHHTRVYLPALSRKARLRLLSLMASRPTLVLGPVLSPPCSRQRPFRAWSLPRSHTAGARHGRPLRVRAPQRGRSARFIRGCLLRSLKAISYFQAITRAHDARAFFYGPLNRAVGRPKSGRGNRLRYSVSSTMAMVSPIPVVGPAINLNLPPLRSPRAMPYWRHGGH